MPVRDEEASDIFSELVPQVMRNTEGRDGVNSRLVRRAFNGLVYTSGHFTLDYGAVSPACLVLKPSRASR